jgi:hypothetical protein
MDYRIAANPAGIPDKDLLDEITRSIWQAVDIYRGPKTTMAGLSKLTSGQRASFTASWCDSEICNGGFHQLFFNSTGVLAEEAVKGFRLIGADSYADLISKAISVFPNHELPLHRGKRIKALESIPSDRLEEEFSPLEERYYKLHEGKGTDWERRAIRYIRSHGSEFFKT